MRPFEVDEPKKDAVVIALLSPRSLASGRYRARVIRVVFAAAIVWGRSWVRATLSHSKR